MNNPAAAAAASPARGDACRRRCKVAAHHAARETEHARRMAEVLDTPHDVLLLRAKRLRREDRRRVLARPLDASRP